MNGYEQCANRRLHVCNLKVTCSLFQLEEMFKRFGHIVKMYIEDCNEASSSAIIEYFEIESVIKAIDALDNRKLGILNDYVSLAFFESLSTKSILVL